MTKNEIKFIIENQLKESTDKITPLLSAKYIVCSKLERKFIDIKTSRFKFDMANEILMCYECREYSGKIPSTWKEGKQYDIYNNKIYKYMFNPNTLEPYIDVYDFDAIIIIRVNNEEEE